MALDPDVFDRLCLARDLLRNSPEQSRRSIREVARHVHMSPFHFIRQFEALFGVTPHQFRIEARLDRAKQLLAAGELSVTSVCMDVGMSSLGSFSDLFARRTGAAPSVFQRRATSENVFPGCLSLMGSLPADAFRNFREADEVDAPVECRNED